MSATGGDRRSDAPDDGELLLPWRAIDRLDAAEAKAIERRLADDPEFARRLSIAVEERDENVALNEALPAPSARVRDDLFARIEAHEAGRSPIRASGIGRWLSERLAALSPSSLAWGATAAAVVIAIQGGLLAGAYLGGGPAGYQTASDGGAGVATPGQTALVAFAPGATADQIAALLREAGAEIVGGPKPGGVFVVRLAAGPLTEAELSAALEGLRKNGVVRLALPERAPAQ